jgi:signal transduction histidine kinase
MNRRIFLQLSWPPVIIGVLLFTASLASIWSIQHVQRNLARILAQNVSGLAAAQELEIYLRQFRFHTFLDVMDPSLERQRLIRADHEGFERAMQKAKEAAATEKERGLVEAVEEGYARYREEVQHGPAGTDLKSYIEWADRHPVRHLQDPCKQYFQVNKQLMEESAVESERVALQTQKAILLLGILGPVSGLVVGYGVSRAWSRSIARLSVRLGDAQTHLDKEVGDLQLQFGKDWTGLDRQVDHVVDRVRDVAQQLQQQERKLMRAEQLAAVGQLAASVAHEVRNPLTGMKLLVEAALRPRASQSLSREDLEVIHGEILRLEQSVQGLLDFARLPAPNKKVIDLRSVIAPAWEVVAARASQQGVTFEFKDPGAPINVTADPVQLTIVLVNLYLNALDAIAGPGRIEAAVDVAGDRVHLRVCDDGPGIPAEMLDHLFEPFATNKPHGTGLGLSLSRRILEEHDGTLSAENRPTRGACFTLELPIETHAFASAAPHDGEHVGRTRM